MAIHDSMNSDTPFWKTSREALEFMKSYLSDEFVAYVEEQAE